MLMVRTLLDMPELRLTLRAGRDLVDRPITRIYGTELLDPRRYLSGGELVVSGLLWRESPEDTETFVAALAAGGAAALAASETDAHALPADLVRACERHRIPLLEVPVDLSFAAITDRVVAELATARVRATGHVLGRHRRLLSVITRGDGLDALIKAGATELGVECWVLSTTGGVVAGDGEELSPAQQRFLVREFLGGDRLPKTVRPPGMGRVSLLPVSERGGHRVVSWLLAVANPERLVGTPRADIAVELANLVGLERARVVQARRTESRTAGSLLRLVLTSSASPAEVAARAAAVGVDTDGPLRVLAATASGGSAELAEDVVTELLAQAGIPAVTGTLGSQTLALLPAAEWSPATADAVRAGLAGLAPGLGNTRLALGISSPAPLARLRGAVEEASHARVLGSQRTQQVCLVSGEEIGLHQFLLSALPEDLRAALRRRVLGPALDYDAQHHSDLVGTLRMFLDCDASWTVTAAKLHVHVNTLRYRLRRLEELLHMNLSDFRQRVDLFLALFAETPG